MTAEVIKVYQEHLPALRLIGKRYTDQDRDAAGSFGEKWGEWIANGWFDELVELSPLPEAEGASYGMMRMEGGQFEYWIGMLFPSETEVPEGYAHADIAEGDVGICWLHGSDDNGELYGIDPHNRCMDQLAEQGWQLKENPWFFEKYHPERFASPDDKGKVILDYGAYTR